MKRLKSRKFFLHPICINFNIRTFKNRKISLFIENFISSRFNFENTSKIVEIRFDVWVHHRFNGVYNIVKLLFSSSWKFSRSIWFENISLLQVCIHYTHNDSWSLWNEINFLKTNLLYTKIRDQLTRKFNVEGAKIVVCSRSQGSYFRRGEAAFIGWPSAL